MAERTLADVVTTIECGDFYRDYDQSVADLKLLRDAASLREQLARVQRDLEIASEAVDLNYGYAQGHLARAEAEVARMRSALDWYANLPKGWTITAGSLTYGDLHLLGEKARAALTSPVGVSVRDEALEADPRNIDAAGRYLRETLQSSKNLTPWDITPKATKKKWLALAEGVARALKGGAG
jgi:hypothetical protein